MPDHYKHFFVCRACGKHVFTLSDDDVPVSPGLTHEEALANGTAFGNGASQAPSCGGLGAMQYCPGFLYGSKDGSVTSCGVQHKGTEKQFVPVPQGTPAEWTTFCEKVSAAWAAFVNSGYSPAMRGANNNREYKTGDAVRSVLQGSGGTVTINGAAYAISNSETAGASLKRAIPENKVVGNIRSFIFHL